MNDPVVVYMTGFSPTTAYMAPDPNPRDPRPLPSCPVTWPFAITTTPSCIDGGGLTEQRCREIIHEELARLNQRAAQITQLEKLIAALGNLSGCIASNTAWDDMNRSMLDVIGEHIDQLRRELARLKEDR